MTITEIADIPKVRMDMTVPDGARFAVIPSSDDRWPRIMDQLWLRTTLLEGRRRISIVSRDEYTARADRVLAALDPTGGR